MDDENRTLIAVNDSVAAEYGFQFYINRFHNPNSSVLLIHVVEPTVISSNQTVLGLPDVREKAANDEKRRIRDLQEKYEEMMRFYGIRGRITVVYYSRNPGKVICRSAVEERCFLIVIGYSSKTTEAKQLGSVCKYVYRKAPCPVAIIPSRDLDATAAAAGTRSSCSSSSSASSSRRGSVIELQQQPPPDYYTARRFSLAVPTIMAAGGPRQGQQVRRVSEADIRNPGSVGGGGSGYSPDFSEIVEDRAESRRSRPARKPIVGPAPDLELVTALIQNTKF